MEVNLKGVVGPQAVKSADNTTVNLRLGFTGEAIFSELNGRYYEQARYGNLYTACNTASTALSTNSTTATGYILTNPNGSGKALVLIEVCVAIAAAPSGASPLLLTGSNNTQGAAVTHTTPLAIQNTLLGAGVSSVAKVDSAATIPATTVFRAIGGGAAASSAISSPFIRDEIAGAIILAPNTCISIQCLSNATSMMASMMWLEIPI